MAGGRRHTHLRWDGRWEDGQELATIQPGMLPKPNLVRTSGTGGDSRVLCSDNNGVPTAWVKRMRESMARLTPTFSADRAGARIHRATLLPVLRLAYRERAEEQREPCAKQASIAARLGNRNGHRVPFRSDESGDNDGQHVFKVQLSLGDLDPMRSGGTVLPTEPTMTMLPPMR